MRGGGLTRHSVPGYYKASRQDAMRGVPSNPALGVGLLQCVPSGRNAQGCGLTRHSVPGYYDASGRDAMRGGGPTRHSGSGYYNASRQDAMRGVPSNPVLGAGLL